MAVDNALRYAGPDTTITVAATRTDRSAELAISDNGPGLPEADLDKAAARFWRGRTDIAGTGLGLASAEITAATTARSPSKSPRRRPAGPVPPARGRRERPMTPGCPS